MVVVVVVVVVVVFYFFAVTIVILIFTGLFNSTASRGLFSPCSPNQRNAG